MQGEGGEGETKQKNFKALLTFIIRGGLCEMYWKDQTVENTILD